MFRRASLAGALLLSFGVPAAAPTDAASARIALTRGPIKISAARAELEQREVALYQGNVRLTSQQLTLSGDRLELRQPSRGQFEARLTGKPAHLTHAAEGEAPAMAATASVIVYDTRNSQIDLTGGVSLTRGTDVLTSDSLRYDVAARRISASGLGAGQVEITIQPPAGALPQTKPPAAGVHARDPTRKKKPKGSK